MINNLVLRSRIQLQFGALYLGTDTVGARIVVGCVHMITQLELYSSTMLAH